MEQWGRIHIWDGLRWHVRRSVEHTGNWKRVWLWDLAVFTSWQEEAEYMRPQGWRLRAGLQGMSGRGTGKGRTWVDGSHDEVCLLYQGKMKDPVGIWLPCGAAVICQEERSENSVLEEVSQADLSGLRSWIYKLRSTEIRTPSWQHQTRTLEIKAALFFKHLQTANET